MGDREEKKPMDTTSEALSWYLKENDIPIKWGPAGCRNGKQWDDGVHQKIEKILVSFSELRGITFQAVYSDSDNIQMLGPQHGENIDATSFKMINVSKPVTRIVGTYQYLDRGKYFSGIASLEFISSEGSYGSIGKKADHSFTFESDLGFSGFHGRVDGISLSSLGVYVNASVKKHLRPSTN